ncbi:tetraspanin-3-like [Haliotis asinina]|uniref:tetraspanin-3-like n=1 Tax=Haliotis asinina TaxID=109174 RepID=UPI003531FAF3
MRTDQKLFCLKSASVIFIIFLWLLGAVIFGILLWFRLDFWSNEYLEVDEELYRYLILLYIFIVVGGLIVGFAILGIVAAVRAIKWAIVTFIVVMVLAIILTAAGMAYGIVYREQLEETISRGSLVKEFIQQRYKGIRFDRATYVIDLMQSELKCCGGVSPQDYTESTWQKENEAERNGRTPLSCCKDYERYQNSNDRFTQSCTIYLQTSNVENEYNPNINRKGCGKALSTFFSDHIYIVVGIGIATFVIEVVTLILISILLKVLNSLYIPQPEEIVYDMAHNQEKSPYPSRGDYRDYYR